MLDRYSPTVLINCAAYTAVDRAEDERDLVGVTINGDAVTEMARYTSAHDIPFVTYSTDYVFSGTGSSPYLESAPVDPVNAYGQSKLVGERGALREHPGALVIRTSWVVSGTHPNFVATMLRLAPERQLSVVADQRGRPTIAADLAVATLAALDAGVAGLLHLANQGETTWFELAQTAVTLAGIPADRIQPCRTEDYPTPAQRPAYSVLGSERLGPLGLDPLPDWRASFSGVVAQLAARAPGD